MSPQLLRFKENNAYREYVKWAPGHIFLIANFKVANLKNLKKKILLGVLSTGVLKKRCSFNRPLLYNLWLRPCMQGRGRCANPKARKKVKYINSTFLFVV